MLKCALLQLPVLSLEKNVNENYLKNTAIAIFKVVQLFGYFSKRIGLDNQHSMVFNLFNRPINSSCFHFF